jgi:hypothetical protein
MVFALPDPLVTHGESGFEAPQIVVSAPFGGTRRCDVVPAFNKAGSR